MVLLSVPRVSDSSIRERMLPAPGRTKTNALLEMVIDGPVKERTTQENPKKHVLFAVRRATGPAAISAGFHCVEEHPKFGFDEHPFRRSGRALACRCAEKDFHGLLALSSRAGKDSFGGESRGPRWGSRKGEFLRIR
jgi:hypothetical protein